MSLLDRMDFESGRMHSTDFLMKNCIQCKNWEHFVKKDYSYCHRCVNNVRIAVKKGRWFTIEGLYDYYKPSKTPKIASGKGKKLKCE